MANDRKCSVCDGVIAAARRLFARYGPSKTSVEEIAREAGYSKATVYNYFSGKESVIAGVIEYDRKELINRLALAVEEAEDPVQGLRTLFLTRTRHMQKHQHEYRAVREDFLRHMPQVVKAIEKNRKEERKIIEGVLHDGIEAGVFHPVKDVSVTADVLFTAILGLTFPLFGKPVPRSLEDRVEELIGLFLTGICSDRERKRILNKERK
jgi:AcrR family transcriptional regulator